jgi:hypothetical protein
MKKTLSFLAAAGLVVALLGVASAQRRGSGTPTLSVEAKTALLEALAGPVGEYNAYAGYNAIVAKFGPVQPYSNIMAAEANHIAALQNALRTYGVAYPANPYLGKITAPNTLLEAAQAGVDEEEANVAMYDRLILAVKAYPNLVRVMTQLKTASLEKHLPALQAALANGGECTGTCIGCGGGCGRK